MPSITTQHGILHYEAYGRGKPVILLHGWLGSVALWRETMTDLGQYCRTYSLDFWGFGESGKKLSAFTVQDFVTMVVQFMEQLGIVSAPLVGHSMGGTVSLAAAAAHPELVQKVVVIGSPIHGSSLAFLLKLAGKPLIARLIFSNFNLFRRMMRTYARFISHNPRLPDMMDADLTRTTLESFFTSIATLRRTDLRPVLGSLDMQVMGMYGGRDNIVHPRQWQPLLAGVPHARIERFPNAGHFIMLDEPQPFRNKLKDFLENEPVLENLSGSKQNLETGKVS